VGPYLKSAHVCFTRLVKVGRLISLTDTRQEGEFYAFKSVLTEVTQEGVPGLFKLVLGSKEADNTAMEPIIVHPSNV